ncbi:MAG TPA: Dyp-type peroxidase [Candidatus Binatia bacterium]|jgi:putative iron-dependent peroxidase|nr:Dyp-type peroxidase [Candidatus Binatia bacterium]
MDQPQSTIQAGPGRCARFLVLELGSDAGADEQVRAALAGVSNLVRAVGHRDEAAALSCVVAIGADAWPRLQPDRSKPAQLHPFPELADGGRRAPSTPGDVLLHIRAEREDFCHELARLILARLGAAVTVIDETHGFVYFDNRDLIGFVDGTENPTVDERLGFTIVGDEDPAHAGGSYVTVQRYVTDLAAWQALSTEAQEGVVGRTKADDVELEDERCLPTAHKERAKIVRDGAEQKIMRHNRAYGSARESGTYFIAYARDLSVTEGMLQRMVVADADGNYDRLLDFLVPVTGIHFFAPSQDVLDALADPAPEAVAEPAETAPSLQIGSLRQH